MIVRLRRDRLTAERGFDRRAARARAGAKPVPRGGLVAALHDREHLSEPFALVWLDEGPGRERAGTLVPVLDAEDAIRCPFETLLDYTAFVRLAFAEADVAFLNEDVEDAADAWDARRRWRRHVLAHLVEADWTVGRGQEWRDVVECPARPVEAVRSLTRIRRTGTGSERRHESEAISFAWSAPTTPAETRPSVPIDDLFDYDRFCLRYLQITKRHFVYEPAEDAPSAYAASAAWRRYVHDLLTASGEE